MGSAFWKFWNKSGNTDGEVRGDCESIEARLDEYAGGGMLDGPESEERARIASHLTHCAKCRAAAAQSERANLAWAAFASVAAPERPGDWAAVRAKLQTVPLSNQAKQEPKRLRRGIPFLSGRSLTAATLAVAAGAVAVMLPSPYRNGNAVAQVSGDEEATVNTARSVPESVAANGGDLIVAPAFVNLGTDETFPIVATLTNKGAAADAEFTIFIFGGGGPRTYHKTARLPANQKSSVMLYPRLGVASIANRSLSFAVTLHGKTQSALLPINSGTGSGQVGYIGKNLAALAPKFYRDEPKSQFSFIAGAYVKPENAPDRAVGYAGLRSLVISHEGTKLSAGQWNAIREWAKSGGSVFLMGGEGNPLLATSEAAEMAPVRQRNSIFDGTLDLKPGAKLRENIVSTAPGLPIANVMWRPFGAGAIIYTDFDATAESLREWEHYNELWQRLTELNGANLGQGLALREAARQRYGSKVTGREMYDPFHLALPSLRSVVYVFLLYFVLVVPVTFVVLKHTRRLNLAWFTGPSLAVFFAAGIYLLTAGLYFMPTARRTAGIVMLTSGEGEGRFSGFTEFFFPCAGAYKIAVPGAELLEERLNDTDKGRGLTTTEDAAGTLIVPEMSVSNMAFRRIYHEQRLTLAGGVTATLKRNSDGGATVTVDNRTGETLREAIIVTSQVVVKNALHPNWRDWETVSYPLGAVAPGVVRRTIARNRISIGDGMPNVAGGYLAYSYPYGDSANMNKTTVLPRRPTLMARLDAAKFGPQLGKDYSASDSVTLVVGLDDRAVETPPVKPPPPLIFAVPVNGRMTKVTVANGKTVIGGALDNKTLPFGPPGVVMTPVKSNGIGVVGAAGYGGSDAAVMARDAAKAAASAAIKAVKTGGAK